MQDLSDEALVGLAQAPDSRTSRAAVDELFRRYQTRVALWCFRVTGDRDWAADLAQEVFLRAWRNLGSFRQDAKFSTWLYTIARNHCFNSAQSRSLRPEASLDELLVPPESGERRIDEHLEAQEQTEIMRDLVNQTLDDMEKQVMTLHYGEELTLDSITRLLGLTNASGAKAYVVSARRKLQTAVARWRAK